MSRPFGDVIKIKPISSSAYETNGPLEKEWSVGSVPNGGYTSMLFASAAVTHASCADPGSPLAKQPHLLHQVLHFFRRTHADHPAKFTIKNVKLGSRHTVIHITLTQPSTSDGEKSLIEGYATLGNFVSEEGVSYDVSKSFLSPPPQPADLSKLLRDGTDSNWKTGTKPYVSFRRSSQHQQNYLPSSQPNSTDWKGIVDEWVRFTPYSDLEPSSTGKWTNSVLPYVVDNFPPPIEQIAVTEGSETPKFWYPTLMLAIDFKKLLPPEGVEWIFLRCRAKVIKNGRMDLDVTILDEQGEVVAVATHSTLILDISRNTTRNKKAGGDREQSGPKEKL